MTEAEQKRQDYRKTMMLTEPLPRVITKMAAPSIISFLITSIYDLADTFFVSSLGTNATAAVSVNASLDQILMMAGSMLAVGAASYISRLLGARKEERASQVFSVAFFSAMAFGLVVLVGYLRTVRCRLRHLCAVDCPLHGGKLRDEPVPAGRRQRDAEYDWNGIRGDSELLFGPDFHFYLGYGRGGSVYCHRNFQICQLCHSDLSLSD